VAADVVGQATEASQAIVDNVGGFFAGIGAEVTYNHAAAMPDRSIYAPSASEPDAMLVGRLVGDVVTMGLGAAEMVLGAGEFGAGAAACGTGVLCIAGAPAMGLGVGEMALGGYTVTSGASGMGENLNILFSKKPDVRYADYLQKKYGLTDAERRALHDAITREGLTREEIEQEAAEMARLKEQAQKQKGK
jgi:hypothetical protein